MICEHCNGFGHVAVFHGDNDIECSVCHGTGETISQLTVAESRDIVRCWGFGGNVPERLYQEALGVLKALEPIITYVLRESDNTWFQGVEFREWQQKQEEYQEILRS